MNTNNTRISNFVKLTYTVNWKASIKDFLMNK